MMYGPRIKELRDLKDMKQGELAQKLEMAQSTLSDLEASIYPTLKRIEQVCDALGIEVWEFFLPRDKLSAAYGISDEGLEMALEIDKLPADKKNKFLKHMQTGLALIE